MDNIKWDIILYNATSILLGLSFFRVYINVIRSLNELYFSDFKKSVCLVLGVFPILYGASELTEFIFTI